MNQVAHLRWVRVYDLLLHFLAIAFVQESLCEPIFCCCSLSKKYVRLKFIIAFFFFFFNLKENIHLRYLVY